MTRFEKYSTFAQKYCKSRYKHPAIFVRDLKAKIGDKEHSVTVAWCDLCKYAWLTTHSRLKRFLNTHEYRG